MSTEYVLSGILSLLLGVHQASVLGHFVIHSVFTITQRCAVKYHLYADDTQLDVSLDPGNKADVSYSLENLERCIADNQLWMTSNLFS